MKNFIHKALLLTLCSSAFVACKPTLDLTAVGPGTADFTRYVSIGDGTPGGYADAALNRESQLAAFPNLLATQFKLVGGGEFTQPLVLPYLSVSTGHTFTSFGFENGKPGTKYDLKYRALCGGNPELHPEMVDSAILIPNPQLIAILSFQVEAPPASGYYSNLAAQGAKMIYMNKKPVWQGTADTYWKKISSTKGVSGALAATMLSDCMKQDPTFVTINVGGVDVLRFAKSGGNQDNGDDDKITPQGRFHDSLYSMMNILTANNTNGLKGVILNIIGVNSFPYFTYNKYNGLILDAAKVAELNALYPAEVAAGQLSFKVGANPYVIEEVNATNACKCRQILENEYVLIEIQDSLRYCYGVGSKIPLRKRWVLDAAEIDSVTTNINAYNAMLKAAAEAYNFAYVDGNTTIKRIVAGTQYSGITLTSEMVSGNQFSLDGLNISPFAHVATANACIVEINKKYGSTIPGIDASKTPSILFH